MNKQEFIAAIKNGLAGLPQQDIDRSAEFYAEMIDDRTDEGISEEEAVASLGSVDEIVSQVLSETSLPKLVKAKIKPKRSLRVWEIVLLILGSPVWFSLLIAAISVFFALYVVIWSLVITVFAVDLSLAVGGLAGMLGLFTYFAAGNFAGGLLMAGAGLICAGLSVLLFFASFQFTKLIIVFSKKIILGIKSLFIKKENVQ